MKKYIFNPLRFMFAAILPLLILGFTLSDEPEKEVYFYAANDRPSDESGAIRKIAKEQVSDKKTWLHTYIRTGTGWDPVKSELVRIKSPDEHMVALYLGALRQYRTRRSFDKLEDNAYRFEEFREGALVRSGQTVSRIPLHLQGLVTEYFDNGQKSSEAFYDDNQLVWNRNWLQNGEKYIDTIFYSVDTWPRYDEGEIAMKRHMNNYIVSSRYYSNDLNGSLLLGFVIMENGDLAGVRLVNESRLEIAGVVKESLETLPGKWKPAILDGRAVRCYMTFPVRFMLQDDMQFENVQFIGNMIFYNYR